MTEPTSRFETERTRRFREQDLSEGDERTISDIENYCCQVVQVMGTAAGPRWSYTVGIYDTCGKPEVITVGLFEETAHFALNQATQRLRDGTNLAKGRHREFVGKFECQFRPVDPKWVRHLMNWANWYYDGAEFPVLQLVYPDLENRFPEEPDFDEDFRQPLLQPDAPETDMERDFWAAQE
jgi:hypothetical protein